MNSLRIYYFFVFSMYAVVVPHYQLFLAALGYSPREVGLLIGFFEMLGVVGPILFGIVADRTGRFRELKVAATISGGVILVALLTRLPVIAAIWISGAAGFLLKTSVPLTDAVAGTVLTDPREQYGRVRVFGSIGFGATALAIPFLSLIDATDPASMIIAFLVAIAIFSIVVLIVPVPRRVLEVRDASGSGTGARADMIAPRETGTDQATGADPDTAASKNTLEGVPGGPRDATGIPRSFWLVIAAVTVGNIAFGAYNSFFSLYLREALAIRSVTVFWAIGAFSEIPIVFFSGRLIKRYGTGSLLVFAGATMAVRLFLYALRPSIPLIILIQTLHAFSFGLMLSAGIAYVNRAIPMDRRASATTTFNAIGLGLAVFVGSTLGGYLVEAVGFGLMFAVVGLFPAASSIVFRFLRSRDPFLQVETG
ncbi:MAG: MFS transporter [Alkalispirochaeta sp.]